MARRSCVPNSATGLPGGRCRAVLWSLLVVAAAPAAVAEPARPVTTLYGTPGLVEMPSAQSPPDGMLSFTTGGFDTQLRNTLSFQITPRLSGSFRYARNGPWDKSFPEVNWDRSFDLRLRVIDESSYFPAVAIGLQDFIGTGRYAAEYLVATKSVGEQVTLTAGLGWGRLGSDGGFRNPLAEPGSRRVGECLPGNVGAA